MAQQTLVIYAVFLLLKACVLEAQYNEDCCFGKTRIAHGETALSLPSCCVSFVCNDGDIHTLHMGGLGSGNCEPPTLGKRRSRPNYEACEFDGQKYDNGTQLLAYCSPLTCVDGSWKVTGDIEECCEHCYLFNTAHVFTFDNNYYTWSGPCNYSVVQTGSTHYPNVAVFSSFRPCFYTVYCLYQTTFRNDPHTLITLRHVAGEAIFQIMVNGQLYTVPDLVVQGVKSGTNTHPVLAWRSAGCLYLLGSSRLMVQHCPHRLDVWTYPTHAESLYGLCGHFNFNPSDDMTARDGTVHPVQPYPLAFPESWRTSDQSSNMCKQPCRNCNNPTRSNPCVASSAEKEDYHTQCSRFLYVVLGPDTELEHHVDACELDLCMLVQGGMSEEEQQKWLMEVVKITQNSKIILAKTKGLFVPEPLFAPVDGFCDPGSSWTLECNKCSCFESRGVPACTLKHCSEDFVPEFGEVFCTNGSRWRLGECVICVCINGGIVCSFTCSDTAPTTSITSPTTLPPATATASTSHPFFVCSLPRASGSCSGRMVRWWYDFEGGRCSRFYYTGCEGNLNNFETREVCEATCYFFSIGTKTVTPATRVPLFCYMKWDAGTCMGSQLKYHFAPETGTCIPSYYTGCGGNDNRFDSLDQCLYACGGNTNTVTVFPPFSSTTSYPCPQDFLQCPLYCKVQLKTDPVTGCDMCVCT